jgi:hypothetical protein
MDEISHYLQKDIHNCGNSELNSLLEIALTKSINNPKWEPATNYVSMHLRTFIRDQGRIGWQQIYNGRIAKSLAHIMEEHYRELEIDRYKYMGVRWTKMLLRSIWNTILKLWKNRNDIIYNKNKVETERAIQENLHQRVHKCYETYNSLQVTDRNLIFDRNIEDILREDKRHIAAWLRIAERIIKTVKRESTAPTTASKLMEKYFSWQKPQTTKRKKERKKPSQCKQDLRPD